MTISDRRLTGQARVTPARRVGDAKPMPLRALNGGQDQVKERRDADPRLQVAYERGVQAGIEQAKQSALEQARGEIQAQEHAAAVEAGGTAAQRLENLVSSFQGQFREMEQELADKTLTLAVQMAQTIVAREIATDPEILLPLVGQCIDSLSGVVNDLKIAVNPADFAVLQLAAERGDFAISYAISTDPEIEPGGCRLDCAHVLIDAELKTRWQRLLMSIGKEPGKLDTSDE